MATFDTWGGSFGTSWAETWFRSTVSAQIGGGGGGPLDMGEESPPFKPIIDIREPADRFREQREKNERVREQLRIALEGPQAEEVRAYVEPIPSDSATPLHERFELRTFSDAQLDTIERFYRAAIDYRLEAERMRLEFAAREQDILDDDDEVMLIL